MLTAIRNFEFNPDDSNAARIFQENRDLLKEPEELPSHSLPAIGQPLNQMCLKRRVLWRAASLLAPSRRQPTQ